MKKKNLAVVLAAALLTGSLAGCGSTPSGGESAPSPAGSTPSASASAGSTEPSGGEVAKTAEELIREPYEEPVKLRIVLGYRDSENPDTPDSVTPETSTGVKLLKEELNIELEYSWIVNSDQYSEKFGAELAAGNLPDIFMLSPNEFEDIASQGGLADLTETYEKYRTPLIDSMCNFDGKVIDAAKKDGKLYGLPYVIEPGQMTSQMMYNMTQLKSVGIESEDQLPKTIAEFEVLCDKLMETDYDGDGKTGGPIMAACKNFFDAQLGDFTPFFHAYESWCNGWYDDGGTLKYAGIQQNLKEPITKLNEWYNKGYFAKDFAAYDIWAADSPVVSDIVSGKYAIVQGSWWVPNWPLNDNLKNNPDANWVIGPNLSLDGEQPTIMLDRYPVTNFNVVGRDCKNPEALFKMLNWSCEYSNKINDPEYKKSMTPEQKLEADSYVYTWMPYRAYSTTCLRDNYNFINQAIKDGKTVVSADEAPLNSEFWGAWSSYLTYKDNPTDPVAWGTYFSRLAPNGGIGNMIKTVETADIIYDEVYISTPAMVKKQGELDKYRDNTILGMIMGETPISDFDQYVANWNAQGGEEISKEVNDWYASR